MKNLRHGLWKSMLEMYRQSRWVRPTERNIP
jgi:hypothetical protein